MDVALCSPSRWSKTSCFCWSVRSPVGRLDAVHSLRPGQEEESCQTFDCTSSLLERSSALTPQLLAQWGAALPLGWNCGLQGTTGPSMQRCLGQLLKYRGAALHAGTGSFPQGLLQDTGPCYNRPSFAAVLRAGTRLKNLISIMSRLNPPDPKPFITHHIRAWQHGSQTGKWLLSSSSEETLSTAFQDPSPGSTAQAKAGTLAPLDLEHALLSLPQPRLLPFCTRTS